MIRATARSRWAIWVIWVIWAISAPISAAETARGTAAVLGGAVLAGSPPPSPPPSPLPSPPPWAWGRPPCGAERAGTGA